MSHSACENDLAELRLIAVALGSNQGNRKDNLLYACRQLRSILTNVVVSSFIETRPEGVAQQRDFLNGAIVGLSQLEPSILLEDLHLIEDERGRKRPFLGAPRTLDLDLVLVGDLLVSAPGIEIPHPRFRDRLFVLQPLAEIAPDMVDPVSGSTIKALLSSAKNRLQ